MILRSKKFKRNAIVLGTLFVVGIIMPHILPAQAGDEALDYIAGVIAWILLLVVQFFGTFLANLSNLLVRVALYNGFGSETFVIRAWVVVRDFANIFFIIALLIIAVATILRIEVYSAKRLLFKLVLMAILINFSRSIAIFIVNISQVIMLYFIGAFKDVSGLLLSNILLLNEYLTLAESADQLANFDLSGLIGNVLLAGVFIAVGTFVVGAIILMLVYRIVFLWLLIILSPLAFLLHAVPGGTSYAGKWWGTFSKNIISGPLIAFFLWLAFFSVSPSLTAGGDSLATQFFVADPNVVVVTPNASSITLPDNLLSFIVGMGLLVGGLLITAQVGGAGASIASGAVSRLQRGGTSPLRGGRRVALSARKWGGARLDEASRPTLDALGRIPLAGQPFARLGSVVGRRVEDRKEKEGKMVGGIRDAKTLKNIAKGGVLSRVSGGKYKSTAQKVAESKMPSFDKDKAKAQGRIDSMDDTGLRDLSKDEVLRLSGLGVVFDNDQEDIIKKQGRKDKIEAMNTTARAATKDKPAQPARSGTGVPTTSASGMPRYFRDTTSSVEDAIQQSDDIYEGGVGPSGQTPAGGVTMGRFGREGSESVTLKVDFGELNKRLESSGAGFEPAHGVRVDSGRIDATRKAVRGMVSENQEKLRGANTRDEKVDALKAFGYTPSSTISDVQLDKQVTSYDAQATRTQQRLDNAQDLQRSGMVLERRGGGADVLRHELRGHVAMEMADESGDKRREIYNEMEEEEKRDMDAYLTNQGRGSEDQDEMIDEYFADILGGQTQGTEQTKKKLEELTKETRAQSQQDGIRRSDRDGETTGNEGGVSETPVTYSDDEILDIAVESAPEVRQVVNIARENVSNPGFLNDPEKFGHVQEAILQLNRHLMNLSTDEDIQMGKIGDRISTMAAAMSEGTQLEVKGALEDAGISEDDVRDVLELKTPDDSSEV